MRTIENGIYSLESIVLAIDISNYKGRNKNIYKDIVIICTDVRILIVQNLKKVKCMILMEDIVRSERDPKNHNKIVFHLKEDK